MKLRIIHREKFYTISTDILDIGAVDYTLTSSQIKELRNIVTSVYKVFAPVKQRRKEDLSIMLMRIESRLVLDRICHRIALEYPEAVIFTIHDSIVTTVTYESVVTESQQTPFPIRQICN